MCSHWYLYEPLEYLFYLADLSSSIFNSVYFILCYTISVPQITSGQILLKLSPISITLTPLQCCFSSFLIYSIPCCYFIFLLLAYRNIVCNNPPSLQMHFSNLTVTPLNLPHPQKEAGIKIKHLHVRAYVCVCAHVALAPADRQNVMKEDVVLFFVFQNILLQSVFLLRSEFKNVIFPILSLTSFLVLFSSNLTAPSFNHINTKS